MQRRTSAFLLTSHYQNPFSASKIIPMFSNTSLFAHSPKCYSLPQPPEPFSYTSEGVTTTFYHYGASINRHRAISCIYYAIGDAGETHSDDWSDPIGEEALRYTYQSVQLSLFPSVEMTWSMWFSAAVAIGIFLDQYNCIAFDYEVEVFGFHRIMGSGSLD